MANTKVTQHVIANNAIQEAMISNAAVTPDKLHGTLDLSSKSITLPSAQAATTQAASDNSTKIATTAYVTTALANLVDSSPSDLNTLNELAAALNDDASFSSTVTTSIAAKLPLAGGTMTGNIAHASDFTIDVGGDISLDADGGEILLKDGGTEVGRFLLDDNNHLKLKSIQSNADILFQGNDGGSGITALRFDMSSAGFATFNDGGSFGGTGALKVPVGTTAQRPSAATGQIRWNSTDGALEVYNGSSWTGVGTTGSNKVLDTFTGDGSTTAFTLSVTPANEDALMVFIDGVYQEKGDYSLSNAVITLDTAPASGEKIAVHTTTASVHDGTSALTQQFTGDGSTTAFTLSQDPNGENNTQVFVNGVYQAKTTYSVSGTTLTFASAPANSAVIEVIMFTVTTLGNTDTVTEGVGNLYHTSARAVSAVSAGNLTGLTVDTNTLSVDATNNKVGIGTTAPKRMLQVGDNSQAIAALSLQTTTTGLSRLYMGDNDSTSAEYAGMISYAHSDDSMQIFTGSSERMRINSSGDVNIGTTGAASGSHKLVVESASTTGTVNSHIALIGDSATNGQGPQILFSEAGDGQAFAGGTIGFTRTGSNSQGALLFGTRGSSGDATTTTTERMRIDSTGALLVGTTSQIVSTTEECVHIKNGDGAGQLFLDNTRSIGNQYMVQIYRLGTRVGSIQTSTTGTSYLETSDYRLKENVDYDFNALERVAQLKPARYNFIKEPDLTVDGFLAHEVSPVVPQAVSGEKDAVDEKGNADYQGIDHSKLVPLLTKAIQEQQDQIEAMKKEIEELKG